MLAKTYNPKKHTVGGHYISEKLDGTRVFWDGGISRGFPTLEIPWANVVDPKTGKMKRKIKPESTGLWSRYGNPIIAPDWFLNLLPSLPLDGEIWAGRGNFQLCRSICAGDTSGPDWDKAEFAVFSSPPIDKIFGDGEIKNANMKAKFLKINFDIWLNKCNPTILKNWFHLSSDASKVIFDTELAVLREAIPSEGRIYLLQQKRLPCNVKEAAQMVEKELTRIMDLGGEGVVIRDPDSIWEPKRVTGLLKYKPYCDAEGTVVGFTSGRETDKGSKHLGRIGALILVFNGKRLELSGLTDEEREFETDDMRTQAEAQPGEDMPGWFQGKHFRVGSSVTFRYRELSDDGIPREASYLRKREVE